MMMKMASSTSYNNNNDNSQRPLLLPPPLPSLCRHAPRPPRSPALGRCHYSGELLMPVAWPTVQVNRAECISSYNLFISGRKTNISINGGWVGARPPSIVLEPQDQSDSARRHNSPGEPGPGAPRRGLICGQAFQTAGLTAGLLGLSGPAAPSQTAR